MDSAEAARERPTSGLAQIGATHHTEPVRPSTPLSPGREFLGGLTLYGASERSAGLGLTAQPFEVSIV